MAKLTQKQIRAALLTGTTDSYTRITFYPDHITVACGSKADRDTVIKNATQHTVQSEHYVNRVWYVYLSR